MTATPKSTEIHSFTAVRGVAALWVALFHFNGLSGGALEGTWATRGDVAVDVFFILSGFVLTYVYELAIKSGTFRYRDFLLKRLARIYPVHFVTMAGALVVFTGSALLGASNVNISEEVKGIIPNLLLVHAWGTINGLPLNYPSWSVSAEFFVYLLFPVAVAIMSFWRRPGVAGALILVATATIFALFETNIFDLTGFSIPRVVPEFLFGVGIFLSLKGKSFQRRWPLVLIGLFPIAVWSGIELAIVLAAGISLSVLFVCDATITKSRVLHHLGVISYSLYMTHILTGVVGFKGLQALRIFPEGEAFPMSVALLMLLPTILVAHLTWLFVERPGHRLVLSLACRRKTTAPANDLTIS